MSTIFYDRNTILSRTLVNFSRPNQQENLHYFDADQKTWRKCEILDNLPYGLATYKISENFFTNQVLVTCTDSYRLSTEPDQEEMDIQKFQDEEKWRNAICKEGQEVDFKSADGWVKAKVCWTKGDVIPGVILIGPRSMPNINGFGYWYKDSRKLAPAGLKTGIISPEQLADEKKKQQLVKEKIDKRNLFIEKYQNSVERYIHKEYKHIKEFYDIRPYYNSLKKETTEITLDFLKENTVDAKDLKGNLSCGEIGLLWIVTHSECDVCFIRNSQKCDQSKHQYICIEKKPASNAIFDIRIKNATFAKYVPTGLSQLTTVEYIDLKQEGDDFVFEGITMDTPLFNSVLGSQHGFYTDGKVIEYKEIFLSCEALHIINSINSENIVSWFPDGNIIMTGHLWFPSIIIHEKDLKIMGNLEQVAEKC